MLISLLQAVSFWQISSSLSSVSLIKNQVRAFFFFHFFFFCTIFSTSTWTLCAYMHMAYITAICHSTLSFSFHLFMHNYLDHETDSLHKSHHLWRLLCNLHIFTSIQFSWYQVWTRKSLYGSPVVALLCFLFLFTSKSIFFLEIFHFFCC